MATENFEEVVVDMIEEDVDAFEDANSKANETIISALDENQFFCPNLMAIVFKFLHLVSHFAQSVTLVTLIQVILTVPELIYNVIQ